MNKIKIRIWKLIYLQQNIKTFNHFLKLRLKGACHLLKMSPLKNSSKIKVHKPLMT